VTVSPVNIFNLSYFSNPGPTGISSADNNDSALPDEEQLDTVCTDGFAGGIMVSDTASFSLVTVTLRAQSTK